MEEVYKILSEEQHEHWDKFKTIHSPKIVNFIENHIGEEIEEEEFIEIYIRLTTCKRKRKSATKTYKFLKKYKWIK